MSDQKEKAPRDYRSDVMKKGPFKAAARALLRGMGLDDDDIAQPFIGVVSTQGEMSPCNIRLKEIAEHRKGGVPRRRNAAGVLHYFSV
jgi:dihydroxy-acid dehydratase